MAYVGTSGRDVVYANPNFGFGTGVGATYGLDGNDTLAVGDTYQFEGAIGYGGEGDDYLYGTPALRHVGPDLTLYGGRGNDFLATGGYLRSYFFGDEGDDALIAFGGYTIYFDGGPGRDALIGGSGSDTLLGGDGDDSGSITVASADGLSSTVMQAGLFGGDGADYIDGGRGNDLLAGEAGDDTLIGGEGDDVIDGGDGVDTIDGGAGRDYISGGTGGDVISASTGNDHIDGGAGNDTIFGGDGEDLIIGGLGTDYLYGGSGSDVFLFRAGDGPDVLVDFVAGGGVDAVALENTGLTSFAQVQALLSYYAPANATILQIGNDQILFAGSRPEQFDASDFIFL